MKTYLKTMGYIVLTIIILAALGGAMKQLGVFAERVVVKNSFQYKEGMAQQAAIWEANLIDLDQQMMMAQTEQEREGIQGQINMIKGRLMAVTLVQ